MLPRLVWKRTGRPLATKALDFEDCIPPPRNTHFSSVTPHAADSLSEYRRAKRQLCKAKRRSISPALAATVHIAKPEPRTLKVLPRYDERNHQVLGTMVSKPKSKTTQKGSTPVSRSEVYIDQLISARKSIDFSAVPKGLGAVPVRSNLKELLLENEECTLEGDSMLGALRRGDPERVDARVSSSFLSPGRKWRWDNESLKPKRRKPSVSPVSQTPELILKQEMSEYQAKVQRVIDTCAHCLFAPSESTS